MRVSGLRIIPVGFLILASSATLWAQQMTLELDPTATRIEFTLPATLHTVHGTFALKRGTLHFDPSTGSTSGVMVVDVKSGQSGSEGRDRKMHKDVLQSDQFSEATFSPSKMSGTLVPQGTSTIQVDGIFRVHGGDHPITLSVPLEIKGTTITARTHLSIPYVEWGMKNPSTFMLRVGEKVELEIEATGHLSQEMQAGAVR
jgi:polyisoprenoid-binding protein YceI